MEEITMVTFEQKPGHLDLHYFMVPNGHIKGIEQNYYDFEERFPEFYSKYDLPVPTPLRNILVVPVALAAPAKKLHHLRQLKRRGIVEQIMFDSGGFQAMTGKIPFNDLIYKNKEFYNGFSDTATILVAPDFPPVGGDSPEVYEEKVQLTLEGTWKLYRQLEEEAKDKYCPVFHPRELQDIDRFFDCYLPIIERSKFCSFSQASLTRGIRSLTKHSVSMIQVIVERLDKIGASLHVLGISSPAAVRLFGELGVKTFDSSSHIQGAKLGNILFPDGATYTCSVKKPSIKESDLRKVQEQTNHICPYCEDYQGLKNNTQFRMRHNLIVNSELPAVTNNTSSWKFDKIRATKAQGLLF